MIFCAASAKKSNFGGFRAWLNYKQNMEEDKMNIFYFTLWQVGRGHILIFSSKLYTVYFLNLAQELRQFVFG